MLGLGRTGVSCARYLRRKGVAVRVADTRGDPPGLQALREDGTEVEVVVEEWMARFRTSSSATPTASPGRPGRSAARWTVVPVRILA